MRPSTTAMLFGAAGMLDLTDSAINFYAHCVAEGVAYMILGLGFLLLAGTVQK